MKSKILSETGVIGGVACAIGGAILTVSLILVALFACFTTLFGCLLGAGMATLDAKAYQDLKRDQRAFDAELWKAARKEKAPTDPIRGHMIDDLLNQYDFTGWTESEVMDLLGPPDNTNIDHRMVWYSLGTYNHDFILKYDENGQVIEYGERWDP